MTKLIVKSTINEMGITFLAGFVISPSSGDNRYSGNLLQHDLELEARGEKMRTGLVPLLRGTDR